MAKGDLLIDSHVSLTQCKKAVEALHSHQTQKKEKFEENQLLPAKEQHVWLNVTVKKLSPEHKLKPVKIPIVHPLVDPRTESVCLITKDPQREYKDLLEANGIKFISRVVGLDKLKGKFKAYDARRALLKENGLFLADERIIPLLPKLLGSKWFEAKKQPIPVCLTRKDLKGELERAISATYMNQNRGTCTAIKVGKLSHTPSQIIENIKTALPAIAKAVRGGWENIQCLHVKTNSSVSLPIWTCSLDDSEGGRWNGLQLEEGEEMDVIEESEEEEVVEKPSKAAAKGKKRPTSSEEEEEVENPRKKAKNASEKEPSTSASKASKSKVEVEAAPSKQPKKSKGTSIPEPAKEEPQPKKAKKQKEAVPAPEPVAAPAPAPPAESQEKKKKSAKAAPAAPTPVVEAPSKKSKASKPEASPVVVVAPAADEDKPAKATKAADPPAASKTSLSKEELKQKRTGAASEKKKEIMTRSKGAKKAKDALLGKKAGQD